MAVQGLTFGTAPMGQRARRVGGVMRAIKTDAEGRGVTAI